MSKSMTIVFSVVAGVLVVACGFLGFMTANLTGKINTLNDDTQAFQTETASKLSTTQNSINGLDSNLAGFKTDTAGQFSTVNGDITGLDSNLTTLKNDTTAFKSETTGKFTAVQSDITGLNTSFTSFKTDTAGQFASVLSDITGINSNIAGLNTDLSGLATQYSESTLNVRQVYDDVINSVCYIYGPVPGGIASGSGFIYRVTGSTGYIITCWHVVDGMSPIYVQLHDGSVVRATLVGSDQDSDVAVIKLTGKTGLMPLPLADSSTLVPGEPVIIVGNPHWTFETVVYGVISRIRGIANVGGVGMVASLIQYDAAQNTGNSGGPVFNNQGQVIGIADNSDTSGEGLHYAVASNKLKRVADAIIDSGFFTSASMPGSWTIYDLTPDVAIEKGLEKGFGVVFDAVQGVGQAQANDVIIAVDGVAVHEMADLFTYFGEFKSPGDAVTFTLIRGAIEIETDVVLEEGWVYWN